MAKMPMLDEPEFTPFNVQPEVQEYDFRGIDFSDPYCGHGFAHWRRMTIKGLQAKWNRLAERWAMRAEKGWPPHRSLQREAEELYRWLQLMADDEWAMRRYRSQCAQQLAQLAALVRPEDRRLASDRGPAQTRPSWSTYVSPKKPW